MTIHFKGFKPFHLIIIFFLLISSVAAQNMKKTVPTEKDSTDALLEAELARELGTEYKSENKAPEVGTQNQVLGQISRTGSSLNPKISAIGLFLGSATEEKAVAKPIDFGLHSAEIVFEAYVDPYTKATFNIGFHNELENPFAGPNAEAAFESEFHAELEEGYVTTLSMPFSLQAKAGKFRSAMGKINQIHPHAYNFVGAPLMYANYFGGEGLVDRGVSLSWLIPNPFDLYQELTLETTSGATESPSFTGTKDLLYLLHLKNYVDLNENTTLELGFTGIRGSNDAERHKSHIAAVDLTLRWKPLRRGRYKSFEWITEALLSRRDTPAGEIDSKGLYSFMRYQLSKRTYIGGRFDYSEYPENGDISEKAYSANLSFFATEFQKFDLQYQYGLPVQGENFSRILLRSVFVIGAHGAHKY
ncbi:MAG: hypothetical protein DWQ05_07420 [Calditrichaeota bacterium]|nr:MAG: hypothetical protein DWQ05_07420 [Calditrichota bacterium]